MALFINVDPAPARWSRRRVYRGWQFGYAGGTQNDFVMDVEVARWRFVCYIGFKYPLNPGPRQQRHEEWRKEQERARERANRPESAFQRLWRSIRAIKTASDRVDPQRSKIDEALAHARQLLASKHELRQRIAPIDRDHERRCQLATRASLPERLPGTSAASIEGELLHQEHQRPAPDHAYQEKPDARELSKEPTE